MKTADHFAFEVADLDAALDFYCGTLGLKLLSRETDEVHGEAFAFLELAGGNLELLQLLRPGPPSGPPREPAPPYCPHLALAVDDLDAVAGRLRRKSVSILKGPMEIPGQVRWLYFADPDGNVLELVQWLR